MSAWAKYQCYVAVFVNSSNFRTMVAIYYVLFLQPCLLRRILVSEKKLEDNDMPDIDLEIPDIPDIPDKYDKYLAYAYFFVPRSWIGKLLFGEALLYSIGMNARPRRSFLIFESLVTVEHQ